MDVGTALSPIFYPQASALLLCSAESLCLAEIQETEISNIFSHHLSHYEEAAKRSTIAPAQVIMALFTTFALQRQPTRSTARPVCPGSPARRKTRPDCFPQLNTSLEFGIQQYFRPRYAHRRRGGF